MLLYEPWGCIALTYNFDIDRLQAVQRSVTALERFSLDRIIQTNSFMARVKSLFTAPALAPVVA